jgi:hypothetical protein
MALHARVAVVRKHVGVAIDAVPSAPTIGWVMLKGLAGGGDLAGACHGGGAVADAEREHFARCLRADIQQR